MPDRRSPTSAWPRSSRPRREGRGLGPGLARRDWSARPSTSRPRPSSGAPGARRSRTTSSPSEMIWYQLARRLDREAALRLRLATEGGRTSTRLDVIDMIERCLARPDRRLSERGQALEVDVEENVDLDELPSHQAARRPACPTSSIWSIEYLFSPSSGEALRRPAAIRPDQPGASRSSSAWPTNGLWSRSSSPPFFQNRSPLSEQVLGLGRAEDEVAAGLRGDPQGDPARGGSRGGGA